VKDVDGLERLMRTLIALGFFAEVDTGTPPVRYRNNRLSTCLREEHVQSQKDFVRPQPCRLWALAVLLLFDPAGLLCGRQGRPAGKRGITKSWHAFCHTEIKHKGFGLGWN
jgi:hypothetical protein